MPRGGKREGAGRKPGPQRIVRAIAMEQKYWDWLDTLAEMENAPLGQVVEQQLAASMILGSKSQKPE